MNLVEQSLALPSAADDRDKLQCRIEALEKERDAAYESVDKNWVTHQQLAAQQLVIEKMREALQMLDRVSNISCGKVQEALALQPSTEALDAYVAEAVKEEREACAKVCMGKNNDGNIFADDAAAAIRARSDKENKT